MSDYLYFTEEDGTVWRLEREQVARSYADYYDETGEEYDDNFNYIMKDEYGLWHWLYNDTKPDDFTFELVSRPAPRTHQQPDNDIEWEVFDLDRTELREV